MKIILAEPISPGQYFWLITTSVVVGGVYIWPQYVVMAAKQNAPWSILGSVLVAYGLIWLRASWAAYTQGISYADVLRKTWGAIGMWLVFVLSLSIGIVLDMALLALYGQLMHTIFYEATPRFVIELLVVGAGAWIASKSLNGLARNVQFWFPGLVLLVLIIVYLSLHHLHYWGALTPSNMVQYLPILHGIGVTWYLFVQGEGMIYLATQVRNTTRRQTRRLAGWAILFQGFWLMLFYVVVVGTIGPQATEVLRWPIVYVFSSVIIQSFFLSGVGTLILLTWSIALTLYLAVQLFCWSWNLEIMLDIGAKTRAIIVVALALITIIGSSLIPSPVWANSVVLNFVNPVDMICTAVILVPSFGISWLKFRHRRQEIA